MWRRSALFLFRLGARRQLDYGLGGDPEQDALVLGEEEYRWVNDLSYTDTSGREHRLAAIEYLARREPQCAYSPERPPRFSS